MKNLQEKYFDNLDQCLPSFFFLIKRKIDFYFRTSILSSINLISFKLKLKLTFTGYRLLYNSFNIHLTTINENLEQKIPRLETFTNFRYLCCYFFCWQHQYMAWNMDIIGSVH